MDYSSDLQEKMLGNQPGSDDATQSLRNEARAAEQDINAILDEEQGSSSARVAPRGRAQLQVQPRNEKLPWSKAVSATLADLDLLENTRQPHWLGGLVTVGFIFMSLTWFLLTAIEKPDSVTYVTTQGTADERFPIRVMCNNDAVQGIPPRGGCFVRTQYLQKRKGYLPSNPVRETWVDHKCADLNGDAFIPVGESGLFTLCRSQGIVDGVIIETTPQESRAEIRSPSGTRDFTMQQDIDGVFRIQASRTVVTKMDGSTEEEWDLITVQDGFAPILEGDSEALLQLGLTQTNVKRMEQATTTQRLALVGGSLFILWLFAKAVVDMYWRCTHKRQTAGIARN